MIKNYNGNLNRSIIRDLRKICEVTEENKNNLLEKFWNERQVSFYTNLSPITGLPDEMSKLVTLKSEKEIEEYIRKDFLDRITGYLKRKKIEEDYLLDDLVDFIKKSNGIFPSKKEMQQLEIAAEAKRVRDLPPTDFTEEKIITEQDVMREILELSEEIMEERRETKPEDIKKYVEPYPDNLQLSTCKFNIFIKYNRHYSHGKSSDYSITIVLRDKSFDEIHIVSLNRYSTDGVVNISVFNWDDELIDILPIDCLIKIHKDIVKLAKKEGIEFETEIDYKKITETVS